MAKNLAVLIPLGLAMLAAGPAKAAQVDLLAETGLISGHQSFTFELKVQGPGDLTVSLSDLHWQGTLKNLGFSLSDSANLIPDAGEPGLDTTGQGGAHLFHVSKPGTYYAHVSGDGSGPYGLGLYSLHCSLNPVSPVPLPAGGLLLASGLLGTWRSWRRKKSVMRSV